MYIVIYSDYGIMIIMMFLSRKLQINPVFMMDFESLSGDEPCHHRTCTSPSCHPDAECHLLKVNAQTGEKIAP